MGIKVIEGGLEVVVSHVCGTLIVKGGPEFCPKSKQSDVNLCFYFNAIAMSIGSRLFDTQVVLP